MRTNSVVNDPRVTREASSLATNGFDVTVLAWDRKSGKLMDEFDGKIKTKRFRLKAPVDSPSVILFFPLFWFWAFLHLVIFRPQVVHACDFDTMPIGVLMKMLKPETKLVYDCFEYYPGMVHHFLTPQLRTLIVLIDKAFTEFADGVILPCEERKKLYGMEKNFMIVPNTPKLQIIPTKVKAKEFTLFYGGELSKERGVVHMIKAAAQLKDIHLVLAGDGPLKNIIKKDYKAVQNITYLGILSHQDTLENMAKAHATVVFYEPTNLNSIYAASNKLFEAMMLGIPIIANKESTVSRIVTRHDCGLVVPYEDFQAFVYAILQLKNNHAVRRKLGKNGKIVFRKRCSWDRIESGFINKYKNLIEK